MLVQLIVVVFVARVSSVHTRHVDTGATHAGLPEMQHAYTDPEIQFKQGRLTPKVNEQQIPVKNGNTYQLRTNSDTSNTRNESIRNRYDMSHEPQNQFTVKAIKPRRSEDRAPSDNEPRNKLTNEGQARDIDRDNIIYKHDSPLITTAFNVLKNQNMSYQEKVREVIRKPLRFEHVDSNGDKIIFMDDDSTPNYNDRGNRNGIVTPPTKPFTNKHGQLPNGVDTMTTEVMDLEDRVALSGDNCPTGLRKIAGSDRCVKVDT